MGIDPLTADHRQTHDDRRALTADLLRAAARSSGPERQRLLGQVVVINIRVARAVAQRYRNRGVSLEDLEQVACEGLVKAVHRFDPAQRHDLLTFAVPTMRGEVLRYFRDHSWSVRPPRRVQELQWRMNHVIDDLYAEHGCEPTAAAIRERLAVHRDAYDEAVAAFGCFQPTSLDRTLDPASGLRLCDTLPDEAEAAARAATEVRVVLGALLRELPARDRHVLHLRFVEDRSQQQIADELGMSQVQVSRLLSHLFVDLRGRLGADELTSLSAA